MPHARRKQIVLRHDDFKIIGEVDLASRKVELSHYASRRVGALVGEKRTGYYPDGGALLTFAQARRFAAWVLRVVPDEPEAERPRATLRKARAPSQ